MIVDNDFDHAIKNCMAVILGYTDLLLEECGSADLRRGDLLEIQKAAIAAVALVDERSAALR